MRSVPVSGMQKDVLVWGGLGMAAVALVYVVIKYALPALTKAVASASTGVVNSVANAPATVAHAAIGGADSLISEFTTPFSDWWKGLDTTAPAPTNAGNLVSSGSTYYPASTGTTTNAGGQDFGVIDGALW